MSEHEEIVTCGEDRCDWCSEDDKVMIVLDRRVAEELSKFTDTYAPLMREVAFACKKVLK